MRYLVGKLHHNHATSNEDRYRCFVYEKTNGIGKIMTWQSLFTSEVELLTPRVIVKDQTIMASSWNYVHQCCFDMLKSNAILMLKLFIFAITALLIK